MKISYTVTMNAAELNSLERIMREVGEIDGLKKGEFKISQKSKLQSTLVKFKLKRTCKLEVVMDLDEAYLSWYADSVERIAPLIRGLLPQLQNLGEEVQKCASRLPQDTTPVEERDDQEE